MIRIFKTEDGAMHEKEEMQPGCWIALTNPTASEILEIADACQIDPDHLKAPLDEEERSRIEAEDEYTLILVDIPSIEERNGKDWFVTIPMAIITTKDVLITVCLEETPILTAFMDGRVRDFHTFMKTRFILQILYKNATQYLQYLRIIDKKSEVIENKLHQSQKNEELIELLELQKSLVYFTTSLRSNEVVLVFKSTSLAYTITLMEVMGHGQLLYGRTYDVMVFGAAGVVYLVVNGLLTLMMRLIERKALAFERRN